MPTDKAMKAYSIYQRIIEHFEDHYYLTLDDLEQWDREAYQAEIRRNLPEDEGTPVLDVKFIDLP